MSTDIALNESIGDMLKQLNPSEGILIEFACMCVEHVLHYYEARYPDDRRPRQAVEVARDYLKNKSAVMRDAAWLAWKNLTDIPLYTDYSCVYWAAWNTAFAVWDNPNEIARDVARAANEAAKVSASERDWQKRTLMELMSKPLTIHTYIL